MSGGGKGGVEMGSVGEIRVRPGPILMIARQSG